MGWDSPCPVVGLNSDCSLRNALSRASIHPSNNEARAWWLRSLMHRNSARRRVWRGRRPLTPQAESPPFLAVVAPGAGPFLPRTGGPTAIYLLETALPGARDSAASWQMASANAAGFLGVGWTATMPPVHMAHAQRSSVQGRDKRPLTGTASTLLGGRLSVRIGRRSVLM